MEDHVSNGIDLIRAWKDSDYRLSLTAEEQAALPEAPANLDELSDAELEEIAGGSTIFTLICPIVIA